jgi:cardiolipin synthase
VTAPAPAAPPGPGGLTLITEPDQGPAPIYAFLASPRRTLDLTMYELVDTRAEGVLAADAGRGVVVRVVLDRNREAAANGPAFAYLAAHGVHVVWAPPYYDATHEKAAVADAGSPAAAALVMTLNLTSRYYAGTRDLAVVDRNPADVAAIDSVFVDDYTGRAPAPTPTGSDLLWAPGAQPALVSLISSARHTLSIENEEMSDRVVIDALVAAARRGVAVEVTMTASGEWDAAFARLTAAGVSVHTFADVDSQMYIHAKAIVADGTVAFVGSENLSVASLGYNRELGLVTSDLPFVAAVGAVLAGDHRAAPAWSG